MVESVASLHQPLPPKWREEYLANLPELQRYCEEMRAWQRTSADPFERADAALWSRLTPHQAQRVFNSVVSLLSRFDAVGEIDRLYREAVEERQIVDPPSMDEFRRQLARVLAQHAAFGLLPAVEV
jgi:DNA-binding FadR family transcriptional regulator